YNVARILLHPQITPVHRTTDCNQAALKILARRPRPQRSRPFTHRHTRAGAKCARTDRRQSHGPETPLLYTFLPSHTGGDMGISLVHTRAQLGVNAPPVKVETHLGPGLPAFQIVGLPETAVRESRDRVRSAIVNSGFQFPAQRITVNLAPADLPKGGGRFDLPIAL